MSSKTTQISTSKIISQIKKLVKANHGDKDRLLFILDKLESGKKISRSDQSYLDKVILAPIKPPKIKKSKVDDKLKSLNKIISLGLGEPERLQYILQSLQEDKKLYRSDSKYLDSKIKEMDDLLKRKKTERKVKRTIKSNSKTKFVTRTLSNSNSSNLENEYEINRKLKNVQDQIKDQRERLSQLIDSNQNKKIKINPIGENSQNKRKIEKNRGPLREQIVGDLVVNKSQLFQIKAQREILSQQILVHKDRAKDTLRKKQEHLENLKTEYDMIQRKTESEKQQITHQIEKRDLNNIPKNTLGKSIKGKIEVSVVALGMTIGFSVVMMKLSDVWPCDVFEMLNISMTQFC